MNNEIIISNIDPQNIIIEGGGSTIGITTVYVNDVDVTVGSAAYVVVPTKLSELQNNMGFITASQEQDPTVPYYVKQISISDINNWNSKQDELVSGSNIKTINGESILGEGNLVVDTSYTAGTGISISDENVISNTITSYDDLTDLPTIPTAVSELTNDADYVSSTVLSPVAFSGDYDDLVDKPTIPTSTSDLDNDSGFITNRVDDLINYYTRDFLYGLLPKVSDEDTSINLSGTYASKLKLDLNSTTLSQDATPTPSSPEDVHVITGDNTIKVMGKNILSNKFSDYNFTASGNYGFIQLSNITESMYLAIYDKDTTVDISGCYLGFSGNGINSSNGVTWILNGASTPVNTKIGNNNYKYISIYPKNETTFNKIFTRFNVMACKGTVPGSQPTFVPYTVTNYAVNLGTTEYCKIGTYADRIFRNVEGDPDYDSERTGTWYLKKNIDKITYNGSENWLSYSGANDKFYCTDKHFGSVAGYEATNKYKCNYFISGIFTSDTNSITGTKYATYINISTTGVSDLATFKTWLENNNTDVYYIMGTPTYTEITGELEDQLEEIYQNAMSYTGQTNISQINDDLPFTISATTLKDISNL